jgi:hypothetical protein
VFTRCGSVCTSICRAFDGVHLDWIGSGGRTPWGQGCTSPGPLARMRLWYHVPNFVDGLWDSVACVFLGSEGLWIHVQTLVAGAVGSRADFWSEVLWGSRADLLVRGAGSPSGGGLCVSGALAL